MPADTCYMNKQTTSLFLSSSPGSPYFKPASLGLISKMLLSSCIFLLENPSGSPGKCTHLGQYLASCTQSLPSSALTLPFHSSQGSLLASLVPAFMLFPMLHRLLGTPSHPFLPITILLILQYSPVKSRSLNEAICLPVHTADPLW